MKGYSVCRMLADRKLLTKSKAGKRLFLLA